VKDCICAGTLDATRNLILIVMLRETVIIIPELLDLEMYANFELVAMYRPGIGMIFKICLLVLLEFIRQKWLKGLDS
jgi:hypothetical protein